MTGSAPTGSITPPICAAALRCTRLPICAHDPTSACESIERALVDVRADVDEHRRHADRRSARRTRRRESSIRRARCGRRRRGRASSASSCPCRRTATCRGRPTCPTVSPKRKPSRMPCLTQVLTRQPDGDAASGSAARTSPRPSARCSSKNASRAAALVGGRRLRRRATRFARAMQVAHARAPWTTIGRPNAFIAARIFSCDAGFGGTIGSRYVSSHRPIAAIANFTGPGLDSTKLHLHEAAAACWCQSARGREVAALGGFDHLHHLGRHLVRRDRNDAAAANRHQRQRQRVVARQHDEIRRARCGRSRPSASCCRTLP